MFQMISRGNAWMQMIEKGEIADINELAEKAGYHRTHVWRLLQVANLSPAITEAILEGRAFHYQAQKAYSRKVE